jgi:hypothetical protein
VRLGDGLQEKGRVKFEVKGDGRGGGRRQETRAARRMSDRPSALHIRQFVHVGGGSASLH